MADGRVKMIYREKKISRRVHLGVIVHLMGIITMVEAVVTLLWKFREFGICRRSVESLIVGSIIS